MFREFTGNSAKGKICFPPLALKASAAGRDRRVALVSDCAAAGSATAHLAAQIEADGWRVTILDLSPPGVPDYRPEGVAYQRLTGLHRETNWYVQMQSLTAYH